MNKTFFVVILLARVLPISKTLLHIVKNKIKKQNHNNWLKNTNFSLKIHKGAGIFKKAQNLSV